MDAGFGTSVARLSGGGQDQAARVIAAMQAQITPLQAVNRNQASEISELRKHSSCLNKIERNTSTEVKSRPATAHNLDHLRVTV